MRIVLDITAMAEAMKLSVEVVLRQLNLDGPKDKFEDWAWVTPVESPTLMSYENFLGVASHFVKKEE